MTPWRQQTLALLLSACCALCAVSAHADVAPDASLKSPTWLSPRSATPHVTKPVATGPSVGLGRSLGVLLLASLLGGTALYLRSRRNQAPKARPAQLRVVGSTKLGGKAQLVLAEVDGRRILLGVTDSSVQKLGWIEVSAEQQQEEEEELAPAVRPRLVGTGLPVSTRGQRLPDPPPVAAPAKRSFRDLLASAVGNLGNRPEDDSAALAIATETVDTFTRSTPRAREPHRTEPGRRAANPQMIDLEGQAKGLLARLGEPRG